MTATMILSSCGKRYISSVFALDEKKQIAEVKEHLGFTKDDLIPEISINTKSEYQQKMNLKIELIKLKNEEENEIEKSEIKNILSELINKEDDLACCYWSSDDLYFNGIAKNEVRNQTENLCLGKRKMKSDNINDSSSPSQKGKLSHRKHNRFQD